MKNLLPWRKKTSRVFDRFQEFLKQRMDQDIDLLDKLVKRRAISSDELNSVLSEDSYEARTDKLFSYISARKTASEFMKVLRETGQSHIANYLESNGEHKRKYGDDWPLLDNYLSILDANEGYIIEKLDPDSCFVALLCLKAVITERKRDALVSKGTFRERNCSLLRILKHSSIGQYHAFIASLRETNRREIANMLDEKEVNSKLSKVNDSSQIQQVSANDRWRDAIIRHYDFLSDRMSPEFGLVGKLFAKSILTNLEKNTIALEKIVEKKNQLILRYLTSDHEPDKLIDALKESGQTHLVRYLEYDGVRKPELQGDWPLTEKETSILTVNHDTLLDLLETSELVYRLYSSGVINIRQKQLIASKVTDYEKNEALLEILRKSSLSSYWQTINCLRAANKSHIAHILEAGGVIARVDCDLNDSNGLITNESEQKIVAQINNLLGDRSLPESNRILEQVLELRLVGAKQSHSISLYFLCQDPSELDIIEKLALDGRFKSVIDTFLSQLMNSVISITLKRSSNTFNYCRNELNSV